jgi:hypothetical protein
LGQILSEIYTSNLEDIFEKSAKQNIDYVIESIEGIDFHKDNIKS